MKRLSASASNGTAAIWPGYRPENHGVGIVHLGLGNFARAHLLAYTDTVLAQTGGDWRIVGVSLRGTVVADSLNPQNGYYTMITRGSSTQARVIGALDRVLAGPDVIRDALDAMLSPDCRIVSLSVTEKGYGITSDGQLDRNHPAVAADLANPESPTGVIGLIVAALARRMVLGLSPFTVLSCDNLSHNGQKLRNTALSFAQETHGEQLSSWIESNISFPSSMVDRITPASSAATIKLAAELTGLEDQAAVETEPFTQWVIEDQFCAGRPEWECAGALFVDDVTPYERMKLRMLNGTHSMLAYSGQLSGKILVRDVMADTDHAALVRRHLAAAAATVEGLAIDLDDYASALCERFSNPEIAHSTAQIAMDGTQKLPQRITAPALETIAAGGSTHPFVFSLASWLAYLVRRNPADQLMPLNDPKASELETALSAAKTPETIIHAVARICPDILPAELTNGLFGSALQAMLSAILSEGMSAVIKKEAAEINCCGAPIKARSTTMFNSR
ncbi:mannitol dehydrogenase family protein [Brucella gallinifaecis]|uniref:Mannitol dehydrogenase family protein n=1 Tax=Brucella gallinifaecis TaxID=215590 RepID=A0A502BL71_9HYPH|nr:mannitol dehydrogenase family protein [Brucella gallinifaecis]TPF74106.1 mannitol dehydrogenase family protein [Brucella gallinifaecis]